MTWKLKPDSEEEALELLRGVIEGTHTEEGCLKYALHRVPDDPGRWYLVEKWRSLEDLEAHWEQPHMAGMGDAAQYIAEGPQVWRSEPVPVGDPDKGAV